MNKNEFVGEVASLSELSKADAQRAVESVFQVITNALKAKEEVRLVGFGTFLIAERKATTGRNPRTGEEIQIAATSVPKFKPGQTLKDAVSPSSSSKASSSKKTAKSA